MNFIIKTYTDEELKKIVREEELAKARAIIKAAQSTEWHLFDAMAFENYDIAEEYAQHYNIRYTDESIEPISEADLLEWIYSTHEIMTVAQWEAYLQEYRGIEYDNYHVEARLFNACIREAYGL